MSVLDPERLLAAAQLGLAMFGMGAVLTLREFVVVFRVPRALAIGLAIQLALIPCLAWGLGRALAIPAGVAAGLVLLAAVPGGTLSNVFTYLLGGNVALSISLTGVTTVGALVTTPAVLDLLLEPGIGDGASVAVGHVTRDIVYALLLPLAAGMVTGARLEAYRETIARWAVRGSLVCILGLAVLGGSEGKLDPRAYGVWGIGAVALFAVAAQAAAALATRAGGLPRGDVLAIATEATIRNSNLALLVQTSVFPAGAGGAIADGMFFVALLYGGVALPVACLPLAWDRLSVRTRR